MILERLFFILTLSLALLLMLGGAAIAQTTQSPLPKPEGYVNDYAKVIDGATKNRMETTLANLDREQQIQFAVVTVDTTGGQDIFDYSMAVARGWGLGSKDTSKPSLLLLVAIKDRKYFTQISRHLEGDLPDGLAGEIQRERIVPAFRAGQYGEGLSNTVNAYVSTIAAKRGFSTDKIFAPGSTSPRGSRDVGGRSGTCLAPVVVLSVIALVVMLLIAIRGRGGRGGFGGGGKGWLALLLVNLLMSSGRGSGSRSSGWSGGGFGGSGGGGGGFGGFGGGGDFGGGGAGGSW